MDASHSPPHVGYALTISAMLEPRVKHIVAPRIQHHTTYRYIIQKICCDAWDRVEFTDDGPPSSKGVLKVVAILEHKPYSSIWVNVREFHTIFWRTIILNAKLICNDVQIDKGLHFWAYRGQIWELPLKGRFVTQRDELLVIVVGTTERMGGFARSHCGERLSKLRRRTITTQGE